MIRLTATPKTFVYGFSRQEVDILSFNDLFSDNIYQLEKLYYGEYPTKWGDDCIKLIVNGGEESITEALCYLLKNCTTSNIKYINVIMWGPKLFFNWECIESKHLILDQAVLERNGYQNQDHFIYSVNCKTETYAY